MDNKIAAVTMRNITKRFGPTLANDKVWLNIYRGEILALLGENGSGKTTLMNMLSGIYFPDEGEIAIDGKPVVIRSPKDAFALGIGMIHQHFKLVDVLTAAENIVLGLPGKLDLRTASRKIKEICDAYGFEVDPDQKIYDMSVSQKQTVEIVKVLYRGADILILDEPTAVLTPQETDKLFAVLRNMRDDGKAVVIITLCATCATTARRSSSSPTRCTRWSRCPTAWPSCATGSLSAICRRRPPMLRR